MEKVNRPGGMMTRVVDGGSGRGEHRHASGAVGRFDGRRIQKLLSPSVSKQEYRAEQIAGLKEKEAADKEGRSWWGGRKGAGGAPGAMQRSAPAPGLAPVRGPGPQDLPQGRPRGTVQLSSSQGWKGPLRRAQETLAITNAAGAAAAAATTGTVAGAGGVAIGTEAAAAEATATKVAREGAKDVTRKVEEEAAAAATVAAAVAAAEAAAAVDPEDGFDFATLYQQRRYGHEARGAVRAAAKAGLLAIRSAATQQQLGEDLVRIQLARSQEKGSNV